MSAAPKDWDGPTAGERTARLEQVWEAANALAAAQFSGSTTRSEIVSIDRSSLLPLRNHRLVDPAIAPTAPLHRRTRSRLVARLCLVAVILIGGTSAIIAFRPFPLDDIWRDQIPSWTQLHQLISIMESQRAIPRLRAESSRGLSGEPLQLRLAIDGPAEGSVVIITGMLTGMDISTGNEIGPDSWQLHSEDVPYAFVAPPEKFVGLVGLIAELRLANDKIVDRQAVYLEWARPPGSGENQYNRDEPIGPNQRVENDPARETTSPLLRSIPSAREGVARHELMSSSALPVESAETGKAVGRSSSASPASGQQETSSSPPFESDPAQEKRSSSTPAASIESDPEARKATAIWNSVFPKPEQRQTMNSSSPPVSTPPALEHQAVTATSTPAVANNPDSKNSLVPSSSSLTQKQGGREAVIVPPSFSSNIQKQVDQNQRAREPALPAFAQRQLDTDEVMVLLKQGKDFIAYGDIAAARVTLKRAAEANNAEAALALASTYDPFVLRELKVYGFSGDTAMARAWYEKAKELGSAVAPRRLEMLARETR
jgi:hypothetical protein